MTKLKASVIIPVYNGEQTVGRCLEALTHQTLPLAEYEILVVDDGSSDQTAKVVSRFPVRLLVQPHRGPAAARNLAIRSAAADIVLFTDADTEPTPDWIETMLAIFRDQTVAGAKGAYRTRQKEWIARFVQIEYEEKYARLAQANRVDVVDTYSGGYRREVALFDGGFDESFPSASVEDAEFSFRLVERGFRFAFLPNAIVYHHHADTLWAYCRRKFKIGYWRVRVHARHPAKALSDAHTPVTQKLQMLSCPLLIALGINVWLIPYGGWLFALVLGGFLLTMIPLTWRALRKDFAIGLLAPLFIASRALAQSGGAAVGVMGEGWRRSGARRIVSVLNGNGSSNCGPG